MGDVLRHGTRLEAEAGSRQVARVIDRRGSEHAHLAWEGDRLVGLEIASPPGGSGRVTIDGDTVPHLLFGRAHRVHVAGARTETWLGAVEWARPTTIPPLEHPGRLPAAAGTTIPNLIALLAVRAGITTLRYAGPYPTAALWQSLAQSFRAGASPRASEAAFTADALARATRLAMDPVPIDFTPAPFERVCVAPGVVAQLRDQLDRVLVGGEAYAPGGGVRRLVRDGASWAAEVWLGGVPWARVCEVDDAGLLVAGPTPLPAVDDDVVGEELPDALRSPLADLIVDTVAAPLAAAVRAELATARVVWGDAGAAAARDDGDAIVVHAVLWQRLAPRGLAQVALALAEALAGPIAARAQARMQAAIAPA